MEEEEYIGDYHNNDNYLHCPKCIQQFLFGINNKNNKIFIKYKCRNNHMGEMTINEYYKEIENNSIYKMICKYCEKLDENMKYCYECEDSFCTKKECLEKHKRNNHNKIIFIKYFDNICLNDLEDCKKCELNLYNELDEKIIENIKNEIKEIEKKRKEIIKKIKNYISDLNKKLNDFKENSQLEIKFIKDCLYSYKLKNEDILNYEIIHNLKNLKFKTLRIDIPECKINNILEDFEIESKNVIYPKNILNYELNEEYRMKIIIGDKCVYESQKNGFIKLKTEMNNGEKDYMIFNMKKKLKGVLYTPYGIVVQINGKFENNLFIGKINIIYSGNKDLSLNYFKELGEIENIIEPKSIKLINGNIEMKVKFIRENTTFYEGETKNMKMEGKGILYFNNGNKYDGEFKNGLMEGKGIYYFKDGDKYDGEFKNNKRNGKGILFFKDGLIYNGEWKNDLCEGKGELINNKGNKIIGIFKKGKPYGTQIYINQSNIFFNNFNDNSNKFKKKNN